MVIHLLFLIVLIIGVFLESVFLPYPVVFITLAFFFFFKRDFLFFTIALLSSLFFDIVVIRNPPGTALFLSLFLVFLYVFERVFAALDVRVYVLFVFLGAEVYRFYAGYPFQIPTSGICFIILMAIGILLSKFKKHE